MKIRILDRILVAVAGMIILAATAAVIAQVFFQVNVVAKAAKVLTSNTAWIRAVIVVACILMLLIGCYCVLLLFRHRSRRDRFIMQRMESGDLAISLKAMETMVYRCLDQRKEIETQSVRLENQRDGLVIRIRGTVASGVSIPLTVDTLQKQIKQYVTACSGVEVKGIRVQIEASGEEAKDAPFAIDAPAPVPLLHGAEKTEETAEPESKKQEEVLPEKEEIPVAATSYSAAESAIEAVQNLKKEYEDEFEDDRPIHQRLFSTPEEPCIMPLPPEDLVKEEPVEETQAETEPESSDPEEQPAETPEAAEPEGEAAVPDTSETVQAEEAAEDDGEGTEEREEE